MGDVVQQFREALSQRGIIVSGEIIADGRIHRCDAEGKNGKGDASYLLHLDGTPAGGFQNWRDGLGWEDWRPDLGRTLTEGELSAQRAKAQATRREREAEEAKRHAQARDRAAMILKESQAASADHPYLKAKGVPAHGLYQYGDALVIPMRESGELHSLQFIGPDGAKRFLSGGRKQGCYLSVGKPDGTLCIAEGYATGATIYETTGYAVAVAFDCGNLAPVAQALRAKFPELRLIFCADDDATTDGNPGLTKARVAARAVGGLVAVPNFGPDRPEGAKDFNDLHQISGAETVRKAVEAASAVVDTAPTSVATGNGADGRVVALEIGELLLREFPPMEPLLLPWLRKQNLAMVHAWRGVGKTHFALAVAYAVASGGPFLNWRAEQPHRVLYIDGEMPGSAIQERLAALAQSDHEPPEGYFRIITPDVQHLPLPNLGTVEGQAAFEPMLQDAELVVIDNLSALVHAGPENESESWLPIQSWALRLRREGRAVLFVHHSGKNGQQRGSSRREDVLDVVIHLKRPSDYVQENGAQFVVEFEKARGLHGKDVSGIEATLGKDEHGRQVWAWREAEGATQDRVVELAKLGMSDAEIATELGIDRSTAYRARRKAEESGDLAPRQHGKRAA